MLLWSSQFLIDLYHLAVYRHMNIDLVVVVMDGRNRFALYLGAKGLLKVDLLDIFEPGEFESTYAQVCDPALEIDPFMILSVIQFLVVAQV
jgi:hypothetical protein